MKAAAIDGAPVNMGIDHENYSYSVAPISGDIRNSLAADLD